MSILVTGGAGFIGSNLVDTLMDNCKDQHVIVIDNLSSGNLNNLKSQKKASSNFSFLKQDLKNPALKLEEDVDVIYHLAANPEVRIGAINPEVHFNENIIATYNLLEAARKCEGGRMELFVFASTSTVYGEASRIPTAEDYGPTKPISIYGATKLASESLVSAYASSYGFRAIIYRLANVIGPRSNHGIIPDLISKLERNRKELEILGDGSQTKSYLHVRDCVSGILTGVEQRIRGDQRQIEIFNLASKDQINIMKIVEIICEQMGLQDVKFIHRNVAPDGRGWIGDVKFMGLDISKLESLGWKPSMSSHQAVKRTIREIIGK